MTAADQAPTRILHIHARFPDGPSARRCRDLVASMGEAAEHRVVAVGEFGSATPPFLWQGGFPAIAGLPLLGRLQRLARAMVGFDLVCTYDYPVMNAVMAQTAFSRAYRLPPLIHHESEGARRSRRADWYRRIALGRCAGLVVSDEALEEAALTAWQQPMGRVKLIREGVDLVATEKPVPPDILPNLLKRRGERWIGGVAGFDRDEQLVAALDAFTALDGNWQLVLLGEGPGRARLRAEAERRAISHRVHLPGPLHADMQAMGLFDIVICLPGVADGGFSAIHAMARGLPVLADRSSEAATLLPQGPAALAAVGTAQFAELLRVLAEDPELRASQGRANRAQAERFHGHDAMIAAYRRLYASAMRRPEL